MAGFVPPLLIRCVRCRPSRFIVANFSRTRGHPGDPFAAWLENSRRAIRKMAVACLRRLLCSGEASESIARRLLELVPNSEDAHIWLLRHAATCGDVSQAFERYHAYAEAMRGSGREPSEEVAAWLDDLVLARHRNKDGRRAAGSTWPHGCSGYGGRRTGHDRLHYGP